MSRIAVPLAVAALLALALFLGASAWRAMTPPTEPGARVAALSRELRCPDCQGLSVAESDTAAARAIRATAARLVAEGSSDAEVRDYFLARYGDWILLQPRTPLAWLAPLVALLAGLALLGWWLRGAPRREAAGEVPQAAEVDPELRRRVRDEAEALDA